MGCSLGLAGLALEADTSLKEIQVAFSHVAWLAAQGPGVPVSSKNKPQVRPA